jgi:hypothetical protein
MVSSSAQANTWSNSRNMAGNFASCKFKTCDRRDKMTSDDLSLQFAMPMTAAFYRKLHAQHTVCTAAVSSPIRSVPHYIHGHGTKLSAAAAAAAAMQRSASQGAQHASTDSHSHVSVSNTMPTQTVLRHTQQPLLHSTNTVLLLPIVHETSCDNHCSRQASICIHHLQCSNLTHPNSSTSSLEAAALRSLCANSSAALFMPPA